MEARLYLTLKRLRLVHALVMIHLDLPIDFVALLLYLYLLPNKTAGVIYFIFLCVCVMQTIRMTLSMTLFIISSTDPSK